MKHLLIFLCGKPLKWFTKPHNLAAALPPTLLSQHFHFLTFPTLPLCWLFCHQSSAPVHPSHLYCRSQLNCQSLREMVTDTPTSTSDVDFLSTNHLPSTLLIRHWIETFTRTKLTSDDQKQAYPPMLSVQMGTEIYF